MTRFTVPLLEMLINHRICKNWKQRHSIPSEPDPTNINWSELKIDLVVECTGFFTKRDDAQKHLSSGSKKVLISAPATNPDITVVYGINHNSIKEDHKIISNGSCTTNCLAPLAFLIEKPWY